ncbi:hypothetical protein BIW11_10285 [Tropilaelaps mercedesae]|uniref:Uncharacterized protein n=1 Tax=Tropilaelaps mercedesae TaxID=418985 RepID=A0A1V9XGD2_9ACAR|nr:hypothetical protein BIW11_10285 [Tropilaelaps mercedesae]
MWNCLILHSKYREPTLAYLASGDSANGRDLNRTLQVSKSGEGALQVKSALLFIETTFHCNNIQLL